MGTVPKQLTQGKTVIVAADTEFSTVKFSICPRQDLAHRCRCTQQS
ncbi:MAG: hypothetical protein M1G31_26610 [Pseudanabaena sp. Salubria-1]|nr:hypothetical protein [Pseudanabaena sp. Salubria-1]